MTTTEQKTNRELPLNLTALLRVRMALLGVCSPDNPLISVKPEQKELAEKTFKIINEAYDSLKKGGNTWKSAYTADMKERISGINSTDKFCSSAPITLGTPLGFLNKVWSYLYTNKNPNLTQSDAPPSQDLESKSKKEFAMNYALEMKKNFFIFYASALETLKAKSQIEIEIKDNICDLPSLFFLIAELIYRKLNGKSPNSANGIKNIKLVFERDTSGKGRMLVFQNSEDKSKFLIIDNNFWSNYKIFEQSYLQ